MGSGLLAAKRYDLWGTKNTTYEGCARSFFGDKLQESKSTRAQEDLNEMHILVAFEEDYRVYQDVVADAIRALRPHVEISLCELDALEAEISRLGPELVICSVPKNVVDANGSVPAWLKLPTGRNRSAELNLDGAYSEVDDPGIDELLWIVDETERLVQVEAAPSRY